MAAIRSWLLGAVTLIALATLATVVILATTGSARSTHNNSLACFRAAVLDHRQQANTKRYDPKADIDLNLQVYERAAKLAKENSADIIVFPEDGLPIKGNRQSTLHYGEPIPNTKVAICTDDFSTATPILHRLACMAKSNGIFVAANLIDVQNCSGDSCPADRKYAFNTAVLFDREGTLLAKYHKMHPFGEHTINTPPKDELVIVDTEIGRLGMQICFDMIYEKPGVVLAAQKKLDTMIFPTWWFDELPFLAASQYQMAWSLGNKVNLLASNIHRVEVGSKGSGLYAGGQGHFEQINVDNDAKTRLLVGSLPVSPNSKTVCPMNVSRVEVPQAVPAPSDRVYWHKTMDLKWTEIIRVDLTQNLATGCSQGVCCSLHYKVNQSSIERSEGYYLLVANRTRPVGYPWTEEYCGLVHCPINHLSPCSVINSPDPLKTRFTYAQLSGNFTGDTIVYPSVIGSQHAVLPKSEGPWNYVATKSPSGNKQTFTLTFGQVNGTVSRPIATIGLYGRAYSRDPPYVQF